MRENAAFEIAAELAFDMGWAGSALAAIAREFEPGGEVRLHGAIEHGTFGPATAIDGSASRSTGGRHGDTSRAIERPQLCAHTAVASMPAGCGTRALVMGATLYPEPGLMAWSAAIVLGVGCTALAFLLFFRLIANVGASRAVTVTFLIPLFGVLWGSLFLGERLAAGMLVGGVIVVLGTALATGVLRWPARA